MNSNSDVSTNPAREGVRDRFVDTDDDDLLLLDDEVSESMMVEFLAVTAQTPSLVLITARPEYRGPLTRVSGAQMIALRPLNEMQAATLAADLLGNDPSLGDLAADVSLRAAGNPFYMEEIVRDLAERGVLEGAPGAHILRDDAADIDVPATLHATIGARMVDGVSPGPEFERAPIASAPSTSPRSSARHDRLEAELPCLPTRKLHKRLLRDRY